ncbi:MAG: class C sortase [Coriobacteriia bacterium]|nr:class C sortase [Coriobacteriia bacterium]
MKNPKSKKTDIRIFIASVIALAGIAVLLYPVIDNLLYENQVASQKQRFFNAEDSGHANAEQSYEDLYQFLKVENERLYQTEQSGLVDAFSYQTAGIDLSRYGIEDDCIGYIKIPSIGVELPIYLGANTENMRKGSAHLTQTSYPIGGENTNAVIAAHRGRTRKMFRNIHNIAIGDTIVIKNFKEELVYRAVEIKIIRPTDVAEIKIQDDRDLITLITCHPLGKNYQRYVLYCERVP